jgi:hypothetical protein
MSKRMTDEDFQITSDYIDQMVEDGICTDQALIELRDELKVERKRVEAVRKLGEKLIKYQAQFPNKIGRATEKNYHEVGSEMLKAAKGEGEQPRKSHIILVPALTEL